MKKFKKYITIVWSTVALLLILVIGYWYYGVSNVETRSSRLIINKISDASLLETYQSQVDYLIDLELTEDSYYTAIIPFNVTAGVDLEETKISQQEESKKINIELPEPQIFKVDQSDEVKPMVLRQYNTQDIFVLVKNWKIFAQEKAKLDAMGKGILLNSLEQAENVFTQFIQASFPSAKLHIEVPQIQNKEYEKRFLSEDAYQLPISLNYIADDKIELHVNEGDEEYINYFSYNAFRGDIGNGIFFRIKRFASTSKFEELERKRLSRLFDPSEPSIERYLDFNSNAKQLYCYYPQGKYTYMITFEYENNGVLYSNFDKILNLSYGLDYNQNLSSEIMTDEYGLSIPIWENCSLKACTAYFWNLNAFYNRIKDTYKKPYKAEIKIADLKRPVIYAHGKLKLRDKNLIRDYIDDIYNLYGQNELLKTYIIGIIYDKGFAHRTRLVVFYTDGFLFYTPKRLIQDRLCKFFKYANVNTESFQRRIQYGTEFGVEIDGDLNTVNHEEIGRYLTWFFKDNYNIVDLYADQG